MKFAQILSRIFFLGNVSVNFSSLESLKKKDKKNLGCVHSKTSSTRRLSIQFSMDHSGSRIPPANCWQIVRDQFGFVASTSQLPQVREEKKNKSPNFERTLDWEIDCRRGPDFSARFHFSYIVLYPSRRRISSDEKVFHLVCTYVLLVRRRGKFVVQSIIFRDRKGKDARTQFDRRSRRDRTSFFQIKFKKRNCSREIDFSNFA